MESFKIEECLTQAANDPSLLDYAACWHRVCFLIKYINYEILLQGITSLCPTREWFVLHLKGSMELFFSGSGGRERSTGTGSLGPCGTKARWKNAAQPEPPGQVETPQTPPFLASASKTQHKAPLPRSTWWFIQPFS